MIGGGQGYKKINEGSVILMKTLGVRRSLLFGSFLLLPLIQFYFSPYIPIRNALRGGIAISLFVFGALFLAGMFFGRAPCGWIMPCGGLQEACFYLNDHPIKVGKKDRLKFWIWSLWLAALLTFLGLNVAKLHLNLFYGIQNGISVSQPLYFIPYYGAVLIVFLLCLIFGKRALCHYGCWIAPFMIIGRKLGNLLHLPGLRLKADPQKCTGCGTCTKVCPMGIEVQSKVKTGEMEHTECILCPECSQACPTKTLRLAFGGRRSQGRHYETNRKSNL